MKFGFAQIVKETPEQAKWIFRLIFALTTALIAWLGATHLFNPEVKYEIMIFLKLIIDPIAYTVSKMFGVVPKDEQK